MDAMAEFVQELRVVVDKGYPISFTEVDYASIYEQIDSDSNAKSWMEQKVSVKRISTQLAWIYELTSSSILQPPPPGDADLPRSLKILGSALFQANTWSGAHYVVLPDVYKSAFDEVVAAPATAFIYKKNAGNSPETRVFLFLWRRPTLTVPTTKPV